MCAHPLILTDTCSVGGEILNMALARAKPHARFVMCGAISQYNKGVREGPSNLGMVITMRIRMQGFIIFDYADRYQEAKNQLAQWLSEGKLKRKETIIKGGLQEAEKALLQLFQGGNTGKLMVEVANPDSIKANL
jgi:NADPH-dependent curcumin reductase CurA